MPASLLRSTSAILEPLDAGEVGTEIEVTGPTHDLLGQRRSGSHV